MCRWLLVSACLALASCASGSTYQEHKTQVSPVSQSAARIYFLRPRHFVSSGLIPDIAVDGQEVGSLPVGGFFHVDTKPGTYFISAGNTTVPGKALLRVQTEPGSTHYILIEPRPGTALKTLIEYQIDAMKLDSSGAFLLKTSGEEEASGFLKDLKYAK
jgi:hypothetical protein